VKSEFDVSNGGLHHRLYHPLFGPDAVKHKVEPSASHWPRSGQAASRLHFTDYPLGYLIPQW